MKRFLAVSLSVSLIMTWTAGVHAATLDYRTAINKIEAKGSPAVIQYFEDGKGNKGKMVASSGRVYSSHPSLKIRKDPNADASVIETVSFGGAVDRVGLCDNGWSKLVITVDDEKAYGYAESYYLSSDKLIKNMNERLRVLEDTEVLNFPGIRDGLGVGEVSKGDTVVCVGVCSDNWSQIKFTSGSKKEVTGFVQNSVLSEIKEEKKEDKEDTGSENAQGSDESEEDEGLIEGEAVLEPSSSGEDSIWAQAATENLQDASEAANAIIVNEGEAVNVSATAKLKPLGDFRITHYCACSICCGPYSGMNSTASGVPPVTNRTIAVDPKQIPFGTKVVVNGQVYVAEDTGSAIKKNCIDIYVATHEEASSKGMYHTEVYLLEED